MNILVTGASGFIAAQIVTDLLAAGHEVTCCVRNVAYTRNLFPTATVLHCDFINDTHVQTWQERLCGIDVVVNCVGILHHRDKKIVWAIHYETPKALFKACVNANIKTVIQISALGIEQSTVEFAKSKKAADELLLKLPITSYILRPSLVYSKGSYGGTSLFRGLAGLPWITPVPGSGQQMFQPIHLQDLSKSILRLIERPQHDSMILNAVGPERVTLCEVLTKIRAWLGFRKTKLLFVPLWLIRFTSVLGDIIPYSAMNMTTYKMLIQNNITSDAEAKKFHDHIGFLPRDFTSGLYSQPSTVQDHWHAKLYFLKPILRVSIAFVWIITAISGLFLYPKANSYHLLAEIGVSHFWQPILLYGSSLLDAALGIALLCGFQQKRVAWLQLILMSIYSIIITWKLPTLWLEPFAPIAKNISLMAATLVFIALESDR